MVIGHTFAWGHIPFTGGDALHQIFGTVFRDLLVEVDRVTDPRKHDPFPARNVDNKRLILNVRRLPTWALSHAYYNRMYRAVRRPAIDLAMEADLDVWVDRMTDGGRLAVSHWAKMDDLRSEILAFVATLRPVTPAETRRVIGMPTKDPKGYPHDVYATFTRPQVEDLYARNPRARAVEERVFDVPVDQYAATFRAGGPPA